MANNLALIGIAATGKPEGRTGPQAGVIVGGSWNAATATAQVLLGDTYAILNDYGDQPIIVNATIAVPAFGHQYAPTGGERCQVVEDAAGWHITSFEHADDTAQTVPAGEWWGSHYSATGSGAIDAQHKLTNDGPTPGDKLGGALLGGAAALTQITTNSGHVITMNDTLKTVTVTSATGHTVIMDDNAATQGIKIVTQGGLVHHLDDFQGEVDTLASKIGLGGQFSALSSTLSAYRQSDVTTFAQNILDQTLQTMMTTFCAAMGTAGVPNAAALAAIINAVSGGHGWVHNIPSINPTIPNGSSITRLA